MATDPSGKVPHVIMRAEVQRLQQRFSEADWFLELLVRMVNDGLYPGVGITLSVGGSLISGDLVGAEEYFAAFGADFASAVGSAKDAESLRQSFASLGKRGTPKAMGLDEMIKYRIKVNPGKWTNYLHLKDAGTYSPTGARVPTEQGVWWRGRISAVDGFTLGKLDTKTAK